MAISNVPRRAAPAARAAAIDIGPAVIRAVEVQVGGDDPRILKRGSAPLPVGAWENLSGSRDALAQAIRSAVSSAGITATQVVASLPRRLVTLKYARFPHADADTIREMVPYEAQQYIPFPLDEVVLDHQIVSDESDEMTTVMIVAARRTLVEDLLAAFDKAGLEVTLLSVSALALGEHAQGGGPAVAILDVESGEMDLTVVGDSKLLFTRAASLGAAAMNDGGGHRLAVEVTRSLTAYQNENRAQPVSKLLFAGSSNDLPIIEETLGAMLEVPVARLNGRLLPSADADALSYATATGLALEVGGGGVSRINLIPQSRLERKVHARRRVNAMLVGAVVIALMATAGVLLSNSLRAQAIERVEAQKENRKLDLAKTALARSRADHDKLKQEYTVLTSSLGRQKPMVDMIKAVSDAVPPGSGLFLTQMAFERGTTLALHGTARSEATATDLVLALQSSGAFREVSLNYMGDAQAETIGLQTPGAQAKAKPGEKMTFLITCKVIGADVRPKADSPTLRKTTTATASASGSTTVPTEGGGR